MSGRPATFMAAGLLILAWIVSGPIFRFSDTWQLMINTTTTIVTFLMVFLIQNTQNRDTEAMHIKLDELIRVTEGAHNALLDLEEMEPVQLDALRERYEQLASESRRALKQGGDDIHGHEDIKDRENIDTLSGPGAEPRDD